MENLDVRCAELGSKLATKGDEKTLTDGLSVLEEQGVYAFFLYLHARGDQGVSSCCETFLKKTPASAPLLVGTGDRFPSLRALGEDLDKLLLARDLLRQALIYGRYHAKASSRDGGRG